MFGMGLGGMMVSAALSTNFQSISINFYGAAHDAANSWLDVINFAHSYSILIALATFTDSFPWAVDNLISLTKIAWAYTEGFIKGLRGIPSFVDGNNKALGDYAENVVKNMLRRKGYTDVIPIQNKRNHGIDIIAKNPQGKWRAFEVKGHFGQGAAKLSDDQADIVKFVTTRLRRAISQWHDVVPEVRLAARSYLEYIQINGSQSIKGFVVNVEFCSSSLNPYISIFRWKR
jgi:Holliday junction resolvase-like predicted endonuclease